MAHDLAGQVTRQRPAWAAGLAGGTGGLGLGFAPGGAFGRAFLEFADEQLQLLDPAVELLRGPAEPRALERGQLHLELFDHQFVGLELTFQGRDPVIRTSSSARNASAQALKASGSSGASEWVGDMT